MKRLIALIISIAMVASLATGLAVTGFAADYDFEIDSIQYKVSGTDVAVYKYVSNSNTVAIPATVTNGTTYNVTSIGKNAFTNCTSLESIIIPNNVTSIGNYAFSSSGLKNIKIGNGVKTIGDNVFDRCYSLTNITVDDGNTYYSSKDGVLYSKDGKELICYPAGKTGNSFTIPNNVVTISDYAFNRCAVLTSIKIPNSVESIGQAAFQNCKGLTSVTIPDSVESIEQGAFAGCTNLTSVTVKATTPPTAGTTIFISCASLDKIYVPAESVDTYKSATNWSTYESKIFAIPSDPVEEETEESDPEVEIDFGYGPVTVKTSNKSLVLNDNKIVETEVLESNNLFVPFDLSNTPVKLNSLFFNNDVYQFIQSANKGVELITRNGKLDVMPNAVLGANPISVTLEDVKEDSSKCATAIMKKAMNTEKVFSEVNVDIKSNGKQLECNAKIYIPVEKDAKVFYIIDKNTLGTLPCKTNNGVCSFDLYQNGTYIICAE